MLDFLNWTVAALADGPPWSTQDGGRLQRADQASMRGVVAKAKGDWAEYVHTLSLQSWSHLFHPCFKCHASREDLAEIGDANLGSPPYAASSPADYDDACAICEIWVAIPDQRMHALFIGMLSKVGRRGRVLQNDFPSLGLLDGDRLQPSRSLRDIRRVRSCACWDTRAVLAVRRTRHWQSIVVPCLRLNHTSQS